MDYKHFSDEKGSDFSKLSGDIQRAIETQANIDLQAYKLSKRYGHVIKDEETEENLFRKLCKKYAEKSEKDLKKLVIMESRALYFYPLTKDRLEYYEREARERAETMDMNVDNKMYNSFVAYSKNKGR